MPYPICSVVAVFKMLFRILNTLPSRIWDMVFFLFSGYLNLQFNNMDCTRSLWRSGKLNSKGLTFNLLYVTELYLIFWQKENVYKFDFVPLRQMLHFASKNEEFPQKFMVFIWNENTQMKCVNPFEFNFLENHNLLENPPFSPTVDLE